jgi:hypothetical protein
MRSGLADEAEFWLCTHSLVMPWFTTAHADGTGVVHLSKAVSSSNHNIFGCSHQLLLSFSLSLLASLLSTALGLLLLLLLAAC